jgi:DNA-binding MltR family transcriptional regulator
VASPKKRKLRDLITDTPTDKQARKATRAFHKGNSLTCAIMCAAVLEGELEILLRKKFKRKDDETWMRLVGEYGPLGSFALKIIAGHAFGLYDEITLKNLNKVREVRNVFAHAKKILTFSEPEIIDYLKTISMPPNPRGKRFNNLQIARSLLKTGDLQGCFICLGVCLSIEIGQTEVRRRRRNMLAKLDETMTLFVQMATAHSVAVPEYIYQLLPQFRHKLSLGNRNAYPTTQSNGEFPSLRYREADEETPQ